MKKPFRKKAITPSDKNIVGAARSKPTALFSQLYVGKVQSTVGFFGGICSDCRVSIPEGRKVLGEEVRSGVSGVSYRIYCSNCATKRIQEEKQRVYTIERDLFGGGGS